MAFYLRISLLGKRYEFHENVPWNEVEEELIENIGIDPEKLEHYRRDIIVKVSDDMDDLEQDHYVFYYFEELMQSDNAPTFIYEEENYSNIYLKAVTRITQE
jgi:hypothetical protein